MSVLSQFSKIIPYLLSFTETYGRAYNNFFLKINGLFANFEHLTILVKADTP